MSGTKDTGGPAFPAVIPLVHSEHQGKDYLDYSEAGMTLRDYFAAKALEEDIKNYMQDEGKVISGTDTLGREWHRREIMYFTREQAKYRYADAMLKARNQ